MKIKYLLRVSFILLLSCNADDSVGNLAFEPTSENKFSIFIPETGTFEFNQVSNKSLESEKVSTYLKVISANESIETLNIEIFAFNDSLIKFENLVFNYRNTISLNVNDSILLDNSSKQILNEDLVKISVFDDTIEETNISGHYEGLARLTESDQNDGEADFVIFNVYGNISKNNQLLLMNIDSSDDYDLLQGVYDFDINDSINFSGESVKDNTANAVAINDTVEILNDGFLLKHSLRLNFTSENQQKSLDLNLIRSNQ